MAVKTPQMVEIVWWDAEDATRTWSNESEIEEFANRPCEICSTGYLLKTTKHYVVIGSDIIRVSDEPSVRYGRVGKIPRPWIRNIRRIR